MYILDDVLGGKTVIFDYEQAEKIYKLIHGWLSSKSVGEHVTKSSFKYYQKELWNPILESIDELCSKEKLNQEEKDFLDLVKYNGIIFRVLNYNPQARRYVCELQEYQSWSKTIDGIMRVPGIHGNVLLLIGKADVGIDVFGLLCFLVKYKYIYNSQDRYSFESIARYEKEEEIVYKTSFDKIEKIVVVNSENLKEYEKNIVRKIAKDLWGRKKIN